MGALPSAFPSLPTYRAASTLREGAEGDNALLCREASQRSRPKLAHLSLKKIELLRLLLLLFLIKKKKQAVAGSKFIN